MTPSDIEPATPPVAVGDLLDAAAGITSDARAANTTRAYDSDWRRFVRWCADRDLCPLPAAPETVVAYLMDAVGDGRDGPARKVSTLSRWVTTMNVAHRDSGLPKPGEYPAVRQFLAGLARRHGTRPRRVAPLLLDDVRTIVAVMDTRVWPGGVSAVRDAALVLTAFAGAFRRSEITGLALDDVTFDRVDGVHLLVRRSKTDQSGQGAIKPVPFGSTPATCTPCALTRWVGLLAAAHASTRTGRPQRVEVMRVLLADDPDKHVCRSDRSRLDPVVVGPLHAPLFRPVTRSGSIGVGSLSGDAVRQVIKRRVAAAGLDPTEFSGHSPRAGFVTEALRHGATAHAIMRQTGHRDPATVEVYARERAPMEGNAVRDLGL